MTCTLRDLRTPLLAVALLCGALQTVSATWLVHDLHAPNASTDIARNLVATGRYEGGRPERLWSEPVPAGKGPLRMFHLPAGVLYQAAALAWLPESRLHLAHVPVTALLVVAVAGCAGLVLGRGVCLLTGVVGSVQPFVVLHGPVWDDTFLGAALDWSLVLLLMAALVRNRAVARRRPAAAGLPHDPAEVAGTLRMPPSSRHAVERPASTERRSRWPWLFQVAGTLRVPSASRHANERPTNPGRRSRWSWLSKDSGTRRVPATGDRPRNATAAAWRTTAGRAGRLTLVALLAGLSALTRSQSQLVLLALAAAMLALPMLRSLRAEAVAVAVGVAVAVTAWGVRNQAVCGTFFVGTTHDGITLYESNYHSARDAIATGQVERLNPTRMADCWPLTAPLDELQANAFFKDRAVRTIGERPAAVLVTGLLKTAVTLTGVRPEAPPTGPRNLVALAANAMLFLLAGLGAAMLPWTPPRPHTVLLLTFALLAVGATAALGILGPFGLRYRIGIDGLLWTAAALPMAAACRSLLPHPHPPVRLQAA